MMPNFHRHLLIWKITLITQEGPNVPTDKPISRIISGSQPDTVRLRVNLTHIRVSAASLWDSAIYFKQDKFLHEMNPGIFIKLQVTNIILTAILLLCMLCVLMWLIFFTGPS